MGVAPDELLVNETVEGLKLRGINASVAINPPTNGIRFSVINAADGPVARGAGLTTWNEHNYLILRLCTELRRRSSRFVSVRTVERALENLGATSPVLVARAKEKLGIEQITRVLRMLASEGVSVRNLRAILERLLEFDYVRCNPAGLMVFDDRIPTKRVPEKSWLQDPTTLVQFVRIGMRRRGEARIVAVSARPEDRGATRELSGSRSRDSWCGP
jgi:flagellar biosynthesis component FlhA